MMNRESHFDRVSREIEQNHRRMRKAIPFVIGGVVVFWLSLNYVIFHFLMKVW